jgi:plasmid stability protein
MHLTIMANLTIRNLPDELHGKLKERARRNRRSLNQEAIVELAAFGERNYGEDDPLAKSKERMLLAEERIDWLRNRMARFMSAKEIDKARKEGRA